MRKSFQVSESGSVLSPFSIAAHCSEREARLWRLFIPGLLAAQCWKREARVVVVVGKFKFPSFVFRFLLGYQNSEKVQVKFSALR